MDGLMYQDCGLGNIWRNVQYTSVRRYFEMGVTGPILWTLALQDPSHREEQETGITLNR